MNISAIAETAYKYIHDTVGITECTEKGVIANINEWYKNKSPLISVLEKHPNWSENNMAVVIDFEETRKLDRRYFDYCHMLFDYHSHDKTVLDRLVTRISEVSTDENISKYFYSGMKLHETFSTVTEACFGTSIDESYIKYINAICPDKFKFRNNAKPSRVLLRYFEFLNLNRNPEFEKLFAKISDCLSVSTLKRKAIISVNPMDFLTMSNGNSWTTCVCLKPTTNYDGFEYQGKHRAGILSHMTDEVSCIFYTLDSKIPDKTPLWEIPKLTRQILFYKYPRIIHERIYPKSVEYGRDETNPYNIYANIAHKIFSECENTDSCWCADSGIMIRDNPDTFQYPDWQYFTTLKYTHSSDAKTSHTITVGGKAYCIHCGNQKFRMAANDDDIACGTLLCQDCFDKYQSRDEECDEDDNNDSDNIEEEIIAEWRF